MHSPASTDGAAAVTAYDSWYSTLTPTVRAKLEALIPLIQAAIKAAEEVCIAAEDGTNAEIEANEIADSLEETLAFTRDVLKFN